MTQEEAVLQKEAGVYRYPAEQSMQEITAQKSNLVNINTATVAELTTVSGIGESRALAIIAYREKNGNFAVSKTLKK